METLKKKITKIIKTKNNKSFLIYQYIISIKIKYLYKMKGAIILLLIALAAAAEPTYTKFPYTIEAEDCDGVDKAWVDIWGKKIGGEFSGKGFAYLQAQSFSFKVTVKEDGMYQFNARVAQILSKEGRLQTISINGIDFSYTIPFYEEWHDFDFGMHRLNKGENTITFKPIYGYAEYDTITITVATFPDFSI